MEGVVEAFDDQDAIVKARENCRQLKAIEPVVSSKLDRLLHMDMAEVLGKKIKAKKLALLCSQLSIELKAGLPLITSLKLVAENEPDKHLKKMLTEVAEDVQAGHGLSDSFAVRAKDMPRAFIETVRAGEESGRLDECFLRLKKYYEDAAEVSSKVGSAMIYPAMLLIVAVVVIAIIMMTAVPVFEDAFADLGNTLPLPTRMLIGLSHFMTDHWVMLLAILLALVLGVILYGKTRSGQQFYAKLALKTPGVKLVNTMKAATQVSTTLTTMLASGLPMFQAVQITANTLDNLLISQEITAAANGILEGRSMSSGLRKSKWLPNLLIEMTAVGEETGRLEETLEIVSEYYNKEVDTAVKRALEILNPVITIVLAVIVVFILLSVYMPLFSMYGSV